MTEPEGRGETFLSSRWGALVRLRMAAVARPWSMSLGESAVTTVKARSVLFPWVREEEHLTYDSISSVRHGSGFVWDWVLIETRGGVNTLSLAFVRKGDAARLCEALRRVCE